MRKKLVSIVSIILIFIGFFLFFQIIENILPKGQGALQVTSNVRAKVLLNGRETGNTPICLCDQDQRVNEGDYTLQLIPEDSSDTFTTKIKIVSGVQTVVDRTFLPGSYASAYVLYLEKIGASDTQIFVSSLPDSALVSMDGNDSGVTPVLLKNVSASEHEIELEKEGYGKKTIRVSARTGYKLIIEAILGTIPSSNEILPGSEITPTPTPTPSTPQVTILDTPTGFLRVRSDASISGSEIGQVKPGDTLPLLNESGGWYQIKLPDGLTGWISSSFAQKIGSVSPTPQ